MGAPSTMAGLAIEGAPVVPVGELCGRLLRVGRAGKLGKDAAQVALRLVAVARDRPAFRETGEIFAPVMLAELGEAILPQRERHLVGGGCARRQIARLRGVALAACGGQQD